jgi:hypothetical protein
MNFMANTKTFLYVFGVLAILAFMYLLVVQSQAYRVEASTNGLGSDYNATSTGSSVLFGAQATTGGKIIKSRGGTLGSIVITGANTGVINFYDATTTNILNRTGNTSTSSILIASFPASTAAGTYTLDVTFNTSLLMELYSGTVPTTTITYR